MLRYLRGTTVVGLLTFSIAISIPMEAAIAQTAASTNWNQRIDRVEAAPPDGGGGEQGYVRLFVETLGTENVNAGCEFKKRMFQPGTWKISGFGDLATQIGQQLKSINEANQTWGIALRVTVPVGTGGQEVPFELPLLAYNLNKQTKDCELKSANRRYISPLLRSDSLEKIGVEAKLFYTSARSAETDAQLTKIGNSLNLYSGLPMNIVGPALTQLDNTFLSEGQAKIAATHTEEFIPKLDSGTVLTVFLSPEVAGTSTKSRPASTVKFETVRSVFSRQTTGGANQDDLSWITKEGPAKIIEYQIGYRGPNGNSPPVNVYEMIRQMVGPTAFDATVQTANNAEKINTACITIKSALANKGLSDLDISIIAWAFGARVGDDWTAPGREYAKAACIKNDGPTLKKAGIVIPTERIMPELTPPSSAAMNLSLGLIELVAEGGQIGNFTSYFSDTWTVTDFTGANLFGTGLSTSLVGQEAIQSFLSQNVSKLDFSIPYPNAGVERMEGLFVPGFNLQEHVRISESLVELNSRPGEVFWATWEFNPYAEGYRTGAVTKLALRRVDDEATKNRFLARHPQAASCGQGQWCPLSLETETPG